MRTFEVTEREMQLVAGGMYVNTRVGTTDRSKRKSLPVDTEK